MKNFYLIIASIILINTISFAANRYWVGPAFGNWTNAANWSSTSGGSGGAGAPGILDNVFFTSLAKVNMNASPVIKSISTSAFSGKVTLVAGINTTITILESLSIGPYGYLLDSTSADVLFNVNFQSGATANILGDWIFQGGYPVSGANGAAFNAPAGTLVNVSSGTGSNPFAGRIICKMNSKPIGSSPATLKFDNYTYFISENVTNAYIPYASWAKDTLMKDLNSASDPATAILLSGNLSSVTYAGVDHNYGDMTVDLASLTSDVSLSIPNKTKFSGHLTVKNTNNRNVTLLAATGDASGVTVEVGTNSNSWFYGGNLTISGNTTKVAMAKAPAAAPSTNYRLIVEKDFVQSGGNFSLQDYNFVTGSSTVDIKGNFNQTGGTFYTNSTTTNSLAKFRVLMNTPSFYTGPSGEFRSQRSVKVSSGTIDNGRNMVILAINHHVYGAEGGSLNNPNGVKLETQLTVGRLELVSSPLTTSMLNFIFVSDPSPYSITVGSSTSYVNGPLRRATNSALPYLFPVGEGDNAAYGYHFDSCLVTPVSTAASVYQAQYYNSAYPVLTFASPLQGVSTNKNFYITRLSGADAAVTLCLDGAVSGATATNGIVVAYMGGNWTNVNGTIKMPGTTTTGSVTSRALSTFGFFTFGYGVPSALQPPIKFPLLNATLSQASSNISEAITKEAKGNSSAYPNPFTDNFTINFYNTGNSSVTAVLDMYDLRGTLVFSQKIKNISSGRNTVKVNLGGTHLPSAIYTTRVTINGIASAPLMLLKK